MQNNKLYVGNLSYTTSEDELKKLFSAHGEVTSIKIIEGKGFGFIEMADSEAAENAKKALNQTEFMGRTIKVDTAREQKDRGRGKF